MQSGCESAAPPCTLSCCPSVYFLLLPLRVLSLTAPPCTLSYCPYLNLLSQPKMQYESISIRSIGAGNLPDQVCPTAGGTPVDLGLYKQHVTNRRLARDPLWYRRQSIRPSRHCTSCSISRSESSSVFLHVITIDRSHAFRLDAESGIWR